MQRELPEGFTIPTFLTAEDIGETADFTRKMHQLLKKRSRGILNIASPNAQRIAADSETLSAMLEGADGVEFFDDPDQQGAPADLFHRLPPSCNVVRIHTKYSEEALKAIEKAQHPVTLFSINYSEEFISKYIPYIKGCKHKLLGIETSLDFYSESLTEEIAALLAKIGHTINICLKYGISPEQIIQNLHMKTYLGNRFLAEVAKLRALRFLTTELLLKTFPTLEKLPHIHIHGATMPSPQTEEIVYDNMLAATIQVTAAVCGGADSVSTLPYDFMSNKKSRFSDRIAKNVLLLLKEEGHMPDAEDPVAGSYYLEFLSYKMARKAWELFNTSNR